MPIKVFVDGQAGTTGLQLRDRLAKRPDLEVMRIEESRRKDPDARAEYLNAADIVCLCLPDEAARESAALVRNSRTRVIDASTAHRVDPAWAYGLPEMGPAQRERIAKAARVSVPGCYATAFVLALRPLVQAGAVPPDYPVVCHAVSGYSGAGRKMIDNYEAAAAAGKPLQGSRHYALGLQHKHLPEMREMAGLMQPPLFNPIICNFAQGLTMAVPLLRRLLPSKPSGQELHKILADHYAGARFVKVMPYGTDAGLDEGTFLDPMALNGTNRAEIFVRGNEEQLLLLCRLDNLGKGASGAAVQCLNLMLGLDEGLGLE